LNLAGGCMGSNFVPGYLELLESGELHRRVEALRGMLGNCRLCARRCGADRSAGGKGACGAGSGLEVSSACVHTGEEPVLTGTVGVGNVFLAGCCLRCVYCQNHEISRPDSIGDPRRKTTPEELASVLLDFREKGCPTVGFVSPTHYAPQLVEALASAAERGFSLPVVYNTGGYDSPELLELLEGIFDIYLPDVKYADEKYSAAYSGVADYPRVAREALLEMHRQVGNLVMEDGVAGRGLLVRLLVLPGDVSGTADTLEFIARELGNDVYISLMSQYYPAYVAAEYPPLDRRLLPGEYAAAVEALERLGFGNGWVQDPVASPDNYLPGVDFSI